jgi:rod shape-determining protein MreD
MRLLFQRPILRLIVVALVVVTLQTTLFVQMRPFGVVIDLLVGVAVVTGVCAGPEAGIMAGFVFGAAIDLLLTTPFGLSGLAYGLAAFLIGLLKSTITMGQVWWLTASLVLAGSALGVGLYLVFGALTGQQGWIRPQMITEIVLSAGVAAVLSPITVRTQRWAMRVERDT